MKPYDDEDAGADPPSIFPKGRALPDPPVEQMLDSAIDSAVQQRVPLPVAWVLNPNDRRLLKRARIDSER